MNVRFDNKSDLLKALAGLLDYLAEADVKPGKTRAIKIRLYNDSDIPLNEGGVYALNGKHYRAHFTDLDDWLSSGWELIELETNQPAYVINQVNARELFPIVQTENGVTYDDLAPTIFTVFDLVAVEGEAANG